MTIDELRYFNKVCQCGSFSEAAKDIHISQQGLGNSIKKLEQEISHKLFLRTYKGIKLTEFGEEFYHYAKQVDESFDALEQFISEKKKLSDASLRINDSKCATFFRPLASSMMDFVASNPEINIRISDCDTDTCVNNVREGKSDVGIVFLPVEADDLNVIPIAKIKLHLVVNKLHRLADSKKVDLIDLKDERFGLPTDSNKLFSLIYDGCKAAGFEPNVIYQNDIPGILEKTVTKKGGVSFIPEFDESAAFGSNEQIAIIKTNPLIEIEIGLLTQKQSQNSRVIRRFVAHLLNEPFQSI